jgi:hypothetical protein
MKLAEGIAAWQRRGADARARTPMTAVKTLDDWRSV